MSFSLTDYRTKRVFVTGHTGFKGSWLCGLLLLLGAEVFGYALAPEDDVCAYKLMGIDREIDSTFADIRDFDALKKAILEARPDIVIHMAAQPLVRESYKNPLYTYETNVMGSVNLLEAIRTAPAPPRSALNVTTDKVYRNCETGESFTEEDTLCGFDPYSNSKSCSELATHSYAVSFLKDMSIAISTARAGNVIGGGDFAADRILPDCVRSAVSGAPITVRNPNSVRPYQHVIEPVTAYLELALRQLGDGSLASCYNIGPDDSDCVTTGELAEMFCESWGEGASWRAASEANAPREAGLLRLDCSKIKRALGWAPVWNARQAVEKTVEWSKLWANGADMRAITEKQISEYLRTQAEARRAT